MKTYRRMVPVLILAGTCLLGRAQRLSAADQVDGAAIFKQNCVMCHGADGKGFAAIHTPDFTDPKVQASMTDEVIADTIKNGKPNTAMKAFGDKLNDDQIQALVKYVRSLNSDKSAGKKK